MLDTNCHPVTVILVFAFSLAFFVRLLPRSQSPEISPPRSLLPLRIEDATRIGSWAKIHGPIFKVQKGSTVR